MRYWKFLDGSIQSCSNDKHVVKDANEISKTKFEQIIASLPAPIITPPRDALQEIDALKAKLRTAGIQV